MAAVYQRERLRRREGVCRRQNRFLGREITPTNYGWLQGDGISRDPIGYKAGTNLNSYAGNNPINRVDPMGTQEETTQDSLGRIPMPPDVKEYIEEYQKTHDGEAPWVGWWDTIRDEPTQGWFSDPEPERYGMAYNPNWRNLEGPAPPVESVGEDSQGNEGGSAFDPNLPSIPGLNAPNIPSWENQEENLSIFITTIIRPTDLQPGVKTTHLVVVNENGQIVDNDFNTGTTDIFDWPLLGNSKFWTSISGANSIYNIYMRGDSNSATLPHIFDIDYKLNFQLNFRNRQGHITGRHDGYPSYTIRIKGPVYDWQQQTIWSLVGEGEINVDTRFRW